MQEKALTSGTHTVVCEAEDTLTVLSLSLEYISKNALPVTDLETKLTILVSKSLHGRYHHQLNHPGNNKAATHTWLRGVIDSHKRRDLLATQDEVIPTRNYLKYITKDLGIVTDLCPSVALHRKLSNT
jgi:hypothetical protein